MLRWRWSNVPLWSLLLLTTGPAVAGELPVRTFFRNSDHQHAHLSPNGRYLAALSPRGPRVCLAVVDLETREAQWALRSEEYDTDWFEWVSDERLIASVIDEDEEFGGRVSVNRDGTRFRRLVTSSRYVWFRYFGRAEGSTEDVFVQCYPWRTDAGLFPDLGRLNVYTGRLEPEVVNPGYIRTWLPDHRGVARAGIGVERDRMRMVYRSDPEKPWQTLVSYEVSEDGVLPIGFTQDNQSLLVLWGGGEDTLGLYRYDVRQHKPVELLFRHQEADVQDVVYHPATGALIGVVYETERRQVFWCDPALRQLQASFDHAFPGALNVLVNANRDGSRLLFLSTTDRSPGTYYLVDASTRKWEKLLDVAPTIPVDQMAAMKPISYRARDGLQIHGYMTLPAHGPQTNLPLVINPHGGPWMRDSWGFDPEVQFLANRGYAVLRVNYRGSTGYGLAFLRAGDRQFGRKMQDDLTDGVQWAIARGVADPKRVAILGASYGGYAVMAGLAFSPELYRCGVNLHGVTDLDTFLRRSEKTTRASRAWDRHAIGDPKRGREELEAVSPLNFVDRIQAPVFLAYGGKDHRVPIDQGKRLASQLKKQGKTYELMIKNDEGHGFFKEENRIELYERIDAFLKRHLR